MIEVGLGPIHRALESTIEYPALFLGRFLQGVEKTKPANAAELLTSSEFL